MSLIDRIKYIEYEYRKKYGVSVSDTTNIEDTASILYACLNKISGVTDSEMPIKLLGCTLDWTDGSNNDTNVKITKGSSSMSYNVTTRISSSDIATYLNAIGIVTNILGDNSSSGSYRFTTYNQVLSDASTLSSTILGE